MNKKVYKTMIALVVIFLVACYVLKIFFPEQFVMAIELDWIVKFGNYVDANLWLHIILACITSFITYWFYLCAVTHKWYLNWKEIIAVLVVIGLTQGLYEVDVTIASYLPLIAMVLLPAIFNGDIKAVGVVFTIHCVSQLLSTSIRSLPLLLTNVNYATTLLMMGEGYFWLLLFYLYYNNKREQKNEN